MFASCIAALNEAVALEMNGSGSGDTKRVEIVSTVSTLRNGLKRCTVQVVGMSGRCHRIEVFGREADELFQEASRLRTVLVQ